MRCSSSAIAALAAGLGLASPALATVTEPNGVVVPLDSNNGEVQLYTLFANRNDPVDWLADAHTTPAVFSPLCDFKATFVLHEAGSNRGVGWYNVDPNATVAPTLGQIHVIVPAGTAVGTVITSATIKGDPAYAGGLIGFALVDGQIHYSEQKWNPVPICLGCTAPWILAVIYQSKSVPNAYYLAFEDGNVDAFSFGNDGDFNDDVFFFEGLTCQGGGTPCSTGLLGACADGLNECSASGLTCKAVVQPSAEKCDGVDNNCDGTTDEGDLCSAGFVCDHGTCVKRCDSGEFSCEAQYACNSAGFCVDPLCLTVTCSQGTVCVKGTCQAPCDGIVCPVPTVCRAGACVDPCAGVTCQAGTACTGGVCVPNCDCNPCATGLACDTGSQRCVEPGCVGMTCTAPAACVAGACVDPCASAVCPPGQECTAGACVPIPGFDAGAGGTGTGGAIVFLTGGITGAGGAGGGAVNDSGTGSGGVAFQYQKSENSAGCSCRVGTPRSAHAGAVLSALALGALVSARRRRRR